MFEHRIGQAQLWTARRRGWNEVPARGRTIFDRGGTRPEHGARFPARASLQHAVPFRTVSRMKANLPSILGFVVAVSALIALYMTQSLFGTGPISIGIQVAAAALMVWARIVFGARSFHAAADPTEGELVTNGPFALVRNPIYASVLLFTWAGVAVHFSPRSAVLGLAVTSGMITRIVFEERMLRARYPQYADYERRVKRLVPFVF